MRLSLCFNPLKVILDTFQDRLSPTFAKTFDEPLEGIAVSFVVIARAASGNHVLSYRTGTSFIRDSNKVFGSKFVERKQSRWIPAVGANTVPVIKTTQPLCIGKVMLQFLTFCSAV